MTKQKNISKQLKAIEVQDLRDDYDEGYISLQTFTEGTDQISPMVCNKDRTDEFNVQLLRREKIGTQRKLSALQRK